MKKCLVIGAGGFLGSSLVKQLLKYNHKVRAFDQFKNGIPIAFLKNSNKLEVFQGDYLKEKDIIAALQDIDIVFHFVWISTPSSSASDPYSEVDINVKYSIKLIKLSLEADIERFIFASSGGAIYGNPIELPVKESHYTNPISPYGIGKLIVEKYLYYYSLNSKITYISLRISNPFGKNQNPNKNQGILSIFTKNIISNKPLLIYGYGDQVRDYIYVEDAINMSILLSLNYNASGVFNIGSEYGLTPLQIVAQIETTLQKKAILSYQPVRPFDVSSIILDIDSQYHFTNFKPTKTLSKINTSINNIYNEYK